MINTAFKTVLIALTLFSILFFGSCSVDDSLSIRQIDSSLDFAVKQTELLAKKSKDTGRLPRALHEDGSIYWTNASFDWTEGFFPGTCWYLYEYSKNEKWLQYAEDFQSNYVNHRHFTTNHDLGFVFNCSYGNGYRLTGSEMMKRVMIDAGNSLLTRFNPIVGSLKSWDIDRGWQATRGWEFPVIIDNIMNLELLFELSKITGDSKYREVAISHANTTLANHFRNDASSYHVVDYNPVTGGVRSKETAQGFSHESVWNRGQAWGLYGFTMCYRYTQDLKYLNMAVKIADFIMSHPSQPEDHIPYWDYSAPEIPNEPRDASAAAINASAMVELSQYVSKNEKYLDEAKKILVSLSSKEYQAKLGENGNFILKHSVGSIPHGSEIDAPLVYADYYYVEALLRLKELEAQTSKK